MNILSTDLVISGTVIALSNPKRSAKDPHLDVFDNCFQMWLKHETVKIEIPMLYQF